MMESLDGTPTSSNSEDFGVILADADVILADTYAHARELNSDLAREKQAGAFGTVATTFASWIEDLWSLYGDGRTFISPVQATMVMSQVLAEHSSGDLVVRPNLPTAAAIAYRHAAGLTAFTSALEGTLPPDAHLAPAEEALLGCLAAYRNKLAEIGLIEQGDAVAYLATHAEDTFPQTLTVCAWGDAPLAPLEQEFLRACASQGLIDVHRLTSAGAMPADTDDPIAASIPAQITRLGEKPLLRFAFPSGAYALPQLLIKTVAKSKGAGPIVISAADPLSTYEDLAPALASMGITCAVRAKKPWPDTLLGQAFLALDDCLTTDTIPWDEPALVDVLASPLLRSPHMQTIAANREVWGRDSQLRADRIASRASALDGLLKNERFSTLRTLVEAPSFVAFDAFEKDISDNTTLSETLRGEQLSALEALKDLYVAAHRLGIEPEKMTQGYRPLLSSMLVDVRHATFDRSAGQAPDVLIETQHQAAQETHASCSTLIVCDLDAAHYPAAQKGDALSILINETLHVPQREDFLARARRTWCGLMAAPSTNLILARCLNDEAGIPTYPSALLEEFTDCYRSDPSLTDDIDNVYTLPKGLQKGMLTLGEDNLLNDVIPGTSQLKADPVKEALGKDEMVALVTEPLRLPASPEGPELLHLSPSQMETYLACPRQWFVTSRVRSEPPDEGFGPREQGSYRHAALKEFYQTFQASGEEKVTPTNLDLAHRMMTDVIAKVRKDQLAPNVSNRCVPLPGTSEEAELERIDRELQGWIDFEATFLPATEPGTGEEFRNGSFVPARFELDLSSYNVSFAGCRLTGIVDRIDVNPTTGRFMIVDYKGKVDAKYAFGLGKSGLFDPTKKIQALVYASAILRAPSLRKELEIADGKDILPLAGALYVSYLKGNLVRGVFSETIDKSCVAHLIGSRLPADQPDETIEKALVALEDMVKTKVVEPMISGDISARPIAKACEYCPLTTCPQRKR